MRMDIITIGIIVGAVVIIIGFILLILSARAWGNSPVKGRLQDFVVEYDRSTKSPAGVYKVQIIQEKFTGSIFSRTVMPALRKISDLFANITPQRTVDEINRKLMIIGNPLNMRALEFNGLRFLVLVLGVAGAVVMNLRNKNFDPLLIAGGFLIIFLSVIAPLSWLEGRVRIVRDDIRYGLPDALDMLSVCAFAGLGFDQSLQRVSEYWQSALGWEFRRVVQEMELGVSRADALRNMSDRLQVGELSSFVAVIIQAENLGMRISDVLHGQAEQMRVLRQFRAKEVANRLPAKMMVPLAFLILPALLAVLFSPLVPSLLDLFSIY